MTLIMKAAENEVKKKIKVERQSGPLNISFSVMLNSFQAFYKAIAFDLYYYFPTDQFSILIISDVQRAKQTAD